VGYAAVREIVFYIFGKAGRIAYKDSGGKAAALTAYKFLNRARDILP